jgi:putative endopeptidase
MHRAAASSIALAILCACRVEPATPPPAAAAGPSAEAQASSAEVLAVMDETADPCSDFYRYACGQWIDETQMPADQSRYGRFHVLRERNQEILRDILSSLPPAGQGSSEEAKLQSFWSSCMDEAAIESHGIEPLADPLGQIAAVKDVASALEMAGRLRGHGVETLLSWHVGPDYKEPDLNVAHLSQGGLGLPDREYYLRKGEESDALRAAYLEHVTTMLGLVGDPDPRTSAAAVLAFETKLAEISTPREELRDPDLRYNRITRGALAKATPAVPWDALFEGGGHPGIEHLNVSPMSYFEGLGRVLKGTEVATVRAYLRWHLVHASADHLPQRFVEADFSFFGAKLNGQKALSPRWKRCVDTTDRALGEALGRLFVERAFAGDSKTIALEMIRQVEEAFADGLPRLQWMDDATRTRALEKMEAVVNKIGYPDEWRDYSALEIGGDHLANVSASAEFEWQKQVRDVGKPVDEGEWHMSPPTVNAYYNPSNNEMVFPAGILQRPFFDADYPMAMNFGGIGMVMGHELTHGFDDQGRKYDGDGKLVPWWGETAVAKFEERAQCVENLYSSYEVQPGVHLNGKLTLGENIADLGGIKESFGAYKAWAAANPSQAPAVEGLTDEQLFFVAFGQIWCTQATPEAERVLALTDPHSHPRFRVNGPLANMPEFWETFSCDEGTGMHPQNTCEVW